MYNPNSDVMKYKGTSNMSINNTDEGKIDMTASNVILSSCAFDNNNKADLEVTVNPNIIFGSGGKPIGEVEIDMEGVGVDKNACVQMNGVSMGNVEIDTTGLCTDANVTVASAGFESGTIEVDMTGVGTDANVMVDVESIDNIKIDMTGVGTNKNIQIETPGVGLSSETTVRNFAQDEHTSSNPLGYERLAGLES